MILTIEKLCPLRVADKCGLGDDRAAIIREHNIKVLNVAGSRGSKEPGVAAFVKRTLEDAFYSRVEAMVLRS